MKDKITFEKATTAHKEIIFSWLAEPHIQEFWDNTQEHKDDILNFMDGRKEPSNYCDGKMVYWIASNNKEPFAMIMIEQYDHNTPIDQEKLYRLSKIGHTYGLDYMIGNTEYLGKGYGAKTLIEFVDFFRNKFDNKADTFIIDPASDNPRAKRVYEKAGFKHISDFVMSGNVSGSGKSHHLLIKKFAPAVRLEFAKANQFTSINKLYDQIGFIHSLPEKDSVVLAKSDNKIIGLGRLVKIDSNNAELGGIYVHDDYRGYGIAAKIVSELLKAPEANSYRNIFCLPFSNLQHFYEKYGFVESNENNIPDAILKKHTWCNTEYSKPVLLLIKHMQDNR